MGRRDSKSIYDLPLVDMDGHVGVPISLCKLTRTDLYLPQFSGQIMISIFYFGLSFTSISAMLIA